MNKTILSIISLNYRKKELTAKSMESLYFFYKEEFEKGDFEYIVVDNNSLDGSLEFLKDKIKKYKNFYIIGNNKNNGFGAGNNLGTKHAKGEYLLFLNNDTQCQDNSIVNMVDFFKLNSQIDFLGGELVNANGTNQVSVGSFYSPFGFLLYILGMQRFGFVDKNPGTAMEVDWIKGACYMVKKSVFINLGGFDEKIFMYTEDMELCFRAKKAGYKIWFYPNTKILHAEQGSSNRSFAIIYIYKGMLYFYKKHGSIPEYYLAKILLKTKAFFLFIIGKIIGNSYLITTYGQALKIF